MALANGAIDKKDKAQDEIKRARYTGQSGAYSKILSKIEQILGIMEE